LHSPGDTVLETNASNVFVPGSAKVLHIEIQIGRSAGERRGKVSVDGLAVMGTPQTGKCEETYGEKNRFEIARGVTHRVSRPDQSGTSDNNIVKR
jgi:hypothetical protein